MNDITLRNKKIKKALLAHYQSKDVSVKGSRGTAYGWVNVKVTLDKPAGCQCNIVEQVATWAKKPYTYKYRAQLDDSNARSTYLCEKCLALTQENQKIMDDIVYGCGAEFSHYYADDGYGTQRAKVLTDVDIRL